MSSFTCARQARASGAVPGRSSQLPAPGEVARLRGAEPRFAKRDALPEGVPADSPSRHERAAGADREATLETARAAVPAHIRFCFGVQE